MKKTFLKSAVIALAGVGLMAGNVMALSISFDDGNDGVTDLEIVDGSVADANGLDGVVLYNGSIGGWELNTTVGTSFPALGTLTKPELDLHALTLEYNPSNTNTGIIAVTVEDTYADFGDLDNAVNGFLADVGGTAVGTVDPSFDINGTVMNLSWADMVHTGNAFSGSSWLDLSDISGNPGDPFAMSITAVITQGMGITTLGANTTVPEPATMLLFGTGLVGLAGVVRKKKIQ